jgi:CRP-like cAMP-binding protein
MAVEDTLRRSEVFLGLNDSDLIKIATLPSSKQQSYQAGHILYKAGGEANNIYVLEEGQIVALIEMPPAPGNGSNQIIVDLRNKGSLLGWAALVRPHLYVLSTVCQKPCKMAVMNGRELLDLFEQDPEIGYKVFLGLSQIIGTRFREIQQILLTGKRSPFIEKYSST